MQFLNKLEYIFYVGIAVIIVFYTLVAYFRFVEDEQIDFKENFWLILIYIILLVLTIFLWRYVYDIVLSDGIIKMITPTTYEIE